MKTTALDQANDNQAWEYVRYFRPVSKEFVPKLASADARLAVSAVDIKEFPHFPTKLPFSRQSSTFALRSSSQA